MFKILVKLSVHKTLAVILYGFVLKRTVTHFPFLEGNWKGMRSNPFPLVEESISLIWGGIQVRDYIYSQIKRIEVKNWEMNIEFKGKIYAEVGEFQIQNSNTLVLYGALSRYALHCNDYTINNDTFLAHNLLHGKYWGIL